MPETIYSEISIIHNHKSLDSLKQSGTKYIQTPLQDTDIPSFH